MKQPSPTEREGANVAASYRRWLKIHGVDRQDGVCHAKAMNYNKGRPVCLACGGRLKD